MGRELVNEIFLRQTLQEWKHFLDNFSHEVPI